MAAFDQSPPLSIGVLAGPGDGPCSATALTGQPETTLAPEALRVVPFGFFFILRAVGDMGNGRMRWLSPLGCSQAIRPYDDKRRWVLILLTTDEVDYFGTTQGFCAAPMGLTNGPSKWHNEWA